MGKTKKLKLTVDQRTELEKGLKFGSCHRYRLRCPECKYEGFDTTDSITSEQLTEWNGWTISPKESTGLLPMECGINLIITAAGTYFMKQPEKFWMVSEGSM